VSREKAVKAAVAEIHTAVDVEDAGTVPPLGALNPEQRTAVDRATGWDRLYAAFDEEEAGEVVDWAGLLEELPPSTVATLAEHVGKDWLPQTQDEESTLREALARNEKGAKRDARFG
jgi:hypothetical protein